MREHLLTVLLDRVLPGTCPDEDFFLSGPRSDTTHLVERDRRRALLADIRRQPRRARHPAAA